MKFNIFALLVVTIVGLALGEVSKPILKPPEPVQAQSNTATQSSDSQAQPKVCDLTKDFFKKLKSGQLDQTKLTNATCVTSPWEEACGQERISLLFHRWAKEFEIDASILSFNIESCDEALGTAKIDVEFGGKFARSKNLLPKTKGRHFIEWDQVKGTIISLVMLSLEPAKVGDAYHTKAQKYLWKLKSCWMSRQEDPMRYVDENITITLPNMFRSGLLNGTVFRGKVETLKLALMMKRLFTWKRPSSYKREYKLIFADDTKVLIEADITGLELQKSQKNLGQRKFYQTMVWNDKGLLSEVEVLINKPLPL